MNDLRSDGSSAKFFALSQLISFVYLQEKDALVGGYTPLRILVWDVRGASAVVGLHDPLEGNGGGGFRCL
jgi:hypothetical protein